ncbi:hypothetical protein TanjilG_16023 [Lupinus angustifolius]|uniref:Hydroxyproline-rich glycoprotein family protein n=1 Tax=Lupinus angustifolius TaxID=3871 RepID=A0A4P1RHM8_LUPAN|nr:PREDICTED: uncharacterized protein At5g65660-like [Lupinus angustifolius]OIW10651.1 hypothetical protein TanjilG_16023 [Lupinus angustifolius]
MRIIRDVSVVWMLERHQDLSPSTSNVDTSRPSIGFPLGTALLLITIFTLSGIFSCCYHWDKFRSLQRTLSDPHIQTHQSSSPKSKLNSTEWKQSMTVLMPGDEVPRFIAMPCPCQPSRPEQIIVTLEKLTAPSKPPQMPVPLY